MFSSKPRWKMLKMGHSNHDTTWIIAWLCVAAELKADVDCYNFVEQEIEKEEARYLIEKKLRLMISHKSEAFRKQLEKVLKYEMIEPS